MSEREWSYQVGHGSCGLYVGKGLQDKIQVSIAPLLPLEGQIHRLDRMLCKVSSHSKKPSGLKRDEKKVREVED